MAHVPIGTPGSVACCADTIPCPGDGAVDVAVFCLALMGTDYGSFLEEAARVLRAGGWLWIAEVRSRFADDQGRDDLRPLLQALKQVCRWNGKGVVPFT